MFGDYINNIVKYIKNYNKAEDKNMGNQLVIKMLILRPSKNTRNKLNI